MISGNRRLTLLQAVVVYGTLAVFLIVASFPVYWIVLTSLKKGRDVFNTEELLIPSHLTFYNYAELFKENEISRWVWVSTTLALASTALALLVGILAAYSLTHFRYKGRHMLALAVFFSYVIPKGLLFIPLFLVLNQLRLVDTFLGLVLAHETFSVPFCTWLLYGYFKTLPKELVDAGRIDGSSEFGLYWRIGLPLSRAALAVLAVLTFLGAWNDYLWPLIVLRTAEKFTYPLGLATLVGLYKVEYGMILAGALIATVPILIIFLAGRKQFVAGLTAGALKG